MAISWSRDDCRSQEPYPLAPKRACRTRRQRIRWTLRQATCLANPRLRLSHLPRDRGANLLARRDRDLARRSPRPRAVIAAVSNELALRPPSRRSRAAHLLVETLRRREGRFASPRRITCKCRACFDQPRTECPEAGDRDDVSLRDLVGDFLQERGDDSADLIALDVESMRGAGQRATKRFAARALREAGESHGVHSPRVLVIVEGPCYEPRPA